VTCSEAITIIKVKEALKPLVFAVFTRALFISLRNQYAVLVVFSTILTRIRQRIVDQRAFEPEIIAVPTSSGLAMTNEILIGAFRILIGASR
jgi:hypothetical protein